MILLKKKKVDKGLLICYNGIIKNKESFMIIGIVGSRRRDTEEDKKLIENKLLEYIEKYPDVTICSGHCPKGGDRFAEELAEKYKLKTIIYPADWKKYGRGAGFMRNTDIVKTSDKLIACVASDRTGGTEDTVKKFIKMKLGRGLSLV